MGQISRRGLLGAFATSAFAGGDAQAQMRGRVDVHVHLLGRSPSDFVDAVNAATPVMDEFRISRAVVLPPPMTRSARFDYSDFLAAIRRHPQRFAFMGGGGTLNPQIHRTPARDVTARTRQEFIANANRILDAGAVGFGEISVLHLSNGPGHSFDQVSADHPLLIALAEVAGERGAAIDLHMDAVSGDGAKRLPAMPKSSTNPASVQGNIPSFERLLAVHRKAKFVWAHGGSDFIGDMTPELVGRLMDNHPNLFISLRVVPAAINENNNRGFRFFNLVLKDGNIEQGWQMLFDRHVDRFVLGSDSFFFPSSLPQNAPARLFGRANPVRLRAANFLLTRLSAPAARAIGIDNAMQIYRLSEG